ncbi:hypothetical protein SKAU_G00189400 [Synaphobranchus kaupii]|uniref:Uncharacterized protein n=1 Tax=Synaphobranchus kaupii TaxID=118154 RepID=A0A9Q1FD91_SYNKA|nr:hypothetical protein SKAU_G00189400 [Synaphobranchus kaupii]
MARLIEVTAPPSVQKNMPPENKNKVADIRRRSESPAARPGLLAHLAVPPATLSLRSRNRMPPDFPSSHRNRPPALRILDVIPGRLSRVPPQYWVWILG